MEKTLLILVIFFNNFLVNAQTTISGKVTDRKGVPILGANIFLEGTYDGASSNERGDFSFKTSETGEKTLTVSFISYETYSKTANIYTLKNLKIKLKEDVNTLDAVEVNAGILASGDNAKVSVLKPLDVVTTAGALGDFVGALQTLPGTSSVEEDGRLFVRGGEAEETQIFIDGIRVFTPYTPAAGNIPVRGRFSPFLFKGFAFSTGGYSAEYGQALSGILAMNTIDEPAQEKTDISFMTVGLGVGNTQKWGRNSFSINTSYINLAPYQKLFPDRNQWNKPVQSMSGEMVYRYKTKSSGLLKLYGAFSDTKFDMVQDDINYVDGFRLGIENRNLYFNGSYKKRFDNNLKVLAGVSYTNDFSNIHILEDNIQDTENSFHAKVKLQKKVSSSVRLSFGTEYFLTLFDEKFNNSVFSYDFSNDIFGTFLETDIYFSKKIASKVGVRIENSEMLNQFTISPRFSLAYKVGANSQLSLAYGGYYQNPNNQYLKFSQMLKAEEATHIIANYQYVKDKQIFRVEGYHKGYDNLVKYNTAIILPTSDFTNNGLGFARGLDVFWRDGKSIKNTEYWLSYSYLDTERDYRNYPQSATPSFASDHNLSLVVKHFVQKWKSQLGISNSFATGRTYTNPNRVGFLNEKTSNYNSLSFNWAYLISQQKILYFSINNLLGTRNVFGYNYKTTPDSNGIFDRQPIIPAVDRFFFVGFFWTISDNKKENQLDNL